MSVLYKIYHYGAMLVLAYLITAMVVSLTADPQPEPQLAKYNIHNNDDNNSSLLQRVVRNETKLDAVDRSLVQHELAVSKLADSVSVCQTKITALETTANNNNTLLLGIAGAIALQLLVGVGGWLRNIFTITAKKSDT